MSRDSTKLKLFVASLGIVAPLLAFSGAARAQQPKPDRPPSAGAPQTPPGAEPARSPGPPATPPGDEVSPKPPEEPTPSEETAAPAPRATRVPALPEEEEPEPPLIPDAADSLAGHFTLSAGAALAFPFGSLADGEPQTDFLGIGPALSIEAAIGVSRTVAIGVWGHAVSFGSTDECPDCSASSFAGGAFVRYHLVQGVRFDPWMSAGLGYRSTSIDTPSGTKAYSGVEWLRLAVGGDWYAISLLGIGPFLELDMGIYNDRPDDTRDATAHFQLLLGARLTLDVPGK